MINTKQEESNSPLEYLITGLVILFFGGLYYFLNTGSSIDPARFTQSLPTGSQPPVNTSSSLFSSSSNLALTGNSSTVKATPPTETSQAETIKPETVEIASKIDTDELTKTNTQDTDNTAELLKLQAEKIALLEARKEQLENDVAVLKDDRANLIETTSALLKQADEKLLPQNTEEAQVENQANTENENIYTLPSGQKIEIADSGFEGLLKQTLQDKLMNNPVTFDRVFFESGEAQPTEKSQDQITATAALLNTHQNINILIKGHSDDIGDTRSNTLLSLTRSSFMKNALVKLGIDARRIKVQGVGSLEPIAPNNSAEGRNTNRRIELILIE